LWKRRPAALKDGDHTRLACGFRRLAESISDSSLESCVAEISRWNGSSSEERTLSSGHIASRFQNVFLSAGKVAPTGKSCLVIGRANLLASGDEIFHLIQTALLAGGRSARRLVERIGDETDADSTNRSLAERYDLI
jgi:hypothetical protein